MPPDDALEPTALHVKRQVLFVQGGGKGVHDDWDAKLVESLRSGLGPSYEIRYPRMPNEDDPSYAKWKPTLERELAALNDGAILVGHSIGGTMLVNALAEHLPERAFGAIFLIAAPFAGEGGWQSDDWKLQRELGGKLPKEVPIYLYHGLADDIAPPSHAELFAHAIPQARVCHLPDRDHQLNNDLGEIAAKIKSLEAAA
jgi:predicted alpha/beta hydrolase family esterase